MKRLLVIASLLFACCLSAHAITPGPNWDNVREIQGTDFMMQSLLAQIRIPGPGGETIGGGGGHTFAAPASANNRCYDGVSAATVSIGCNLTTAPASGSVVTVTVFLQPSTISPTVSDGTNSYSCTTISSTNDATSGSAMICSWYATTTGGTNLTLSFTGTCNFCSITVDNWGVTGAGAVTVADSQSGSGTTGTTINTPTITGNTGDLQLCLGASENGISAVAGGWVAEPATGSFGEKSEYVLSGAGAKAANFTQSSGHWDSKCAALH